jgi:hypothetical protein
MPRFNPILPNDLFNLLFHNKKYITINTNTNRNNPIILKNLIYKSHKKVQKKFPAYERKKITTERSEKNFCVTRHTKEKPPNTRKGGFHVIKNPSDYKGF